MMIEQFAVLDEAELVAGEFLDRRGVLSQASNVVGDARRCVALISSMAACCVAMRWRTSDVGQQPALAEHAVDDREHEHQHQPRPQHAAAHRRHGVAPAARRGLAGLDWRIGSGADIRAMRTIQESPAPHNAETGADRPDPVVIVLTTWPDDRLRRASRRQLVEARHAACVTRLPRQPVVYRWQGAMEEAEEQQWVIKTTARALDALVGCGARRAPVRDARVARAHRRRRQ